MSMYMIEKATLEEIGDAVRAKLGTTALIPVTSLATKIAGISTGVELNYKVVGGTTAPSSPSTNTIWVNTSTTITSHVFSATQPTGATGKVWFKVSDSSPVSFNALKTNTITVYPVSCKQYVSGAWVDKTAKTYQSGAWKAWSVYLYNQGDKCTALTGGWTAGAMANSNGGKAPTVVYNTDSMVITGPSSNGYAQGGAVYTTDKVSLSGVSTLVLDGSILTAWTDNVKKIMLCVWTTISTTYSAANLAASAELSGSTAGAVSKSLDVSDLTGEYYIGLYFVGATELEMQSMYLK